MLQVGNRNIDEVMASVTQSGSPQLINAMHGGGVQKQGRSPGPANMRQQQHIQQQQQQQQQYIPNRQPGQAQHNRYQVLQQQNQRLGSPQAQQVQQVQLQGHQVQAQQMQGRQVQGQLVQQQNTSMVQQLASGGARRQANTVVLSNAQQGNALALQQQQTQAQVISTQQNIIDQRAGHMARLGGQSTVEKEKVMAILQKAQQEVGSNPSSVATVQASQAGQMVATPQRQAIQQVQPGATNTPNVSRPVPSAGSVDAIKNPNPSPATAKKIQLILMADGRYKDKDGTILPDAYVEQLLSKSNVISRTGTKQVAMAGQAQRALQMTAQQQQGQPQVLQTQQAGQAIQQKILQPQQRMMSQAQGIQQNVVYQQQRVQQPGMAQQQPQQHRVITAAPQQQPQTQQVLQQQQLLQQQQGQRQMIIPQQQQQTLQQQRVQQIQQQRLQQQQLQGGTQQLQLTSSAGNTIINQSPGNPQYVQNNQQMVQIIPQQKPTTYNRQPQTLIRTTLNQPVQAQQMRTVQGMQTPYQKQSPTVIQLPQGGQTIQTASQNGPVLQYITTMQDAPGQPVQRAQPTLIRQRKPTKKQLQREAMLASGDQSGVQYVQNVSSPGLPQQRVGSVQYKQVLSGNQIVTTGVGQVPQTVVHGSMSGAQSGLGQIAAAYDSNTPQGSPGQPLTHSGLIQQGQQQPQVTMASALLAKRQSLQGGTVLAGPDDDSPPSTPVRPGLVAHSQQGIRMVATAPGQTGRPRAPATATSKITPSVSLPDGTDVTNNLKSLPAGTSVLVKRHDGAQLQAMWNGNNITLSSSHTMQGERILFYIPPRSFIFPNICST